MMKCQSVGDKFGRPDLDWNQFIEGAIKYVGCIDHVWSGEITEADQFYKT